MSYGISPLQLSAQIFLFKKPKEGFLVLLPTEFLLAVNSCTALPTRFMKVSSTSLEKPPAIFLCLSKVSAVAPVPTTLMPSDENKNARVAWSFFIK
ncbi:hypothetical protein DPMN_023413 [Dreissena polymorpha]|uniref:Uncharacterized protein n=1 Tax=Dreissena polymorpha TaxID=45954 RepID=A0A9D4LKP3_DREPO|nr:hypothetical protein DPMN_023413 [Dreissena polymorpha]